MNMNENFLSLFYRINNYLSRNSISTIALSTKIFFPGGTQPRRKISEIPGVGEGVTIKYPLEGKFRGGSGGLKPCPKYLLNFYFFRPFPFYLRQKKKTTEKDKPC